MARWYKLESTKPLKTKQGCIDKVLHVWPHRPPPDEVLARALGQQLILLFKEELVALMLARHRGAGDGQTRDCCAPAKKRRSKRKRVTDHSDAKDSPRLSDY